LIKKYQKYGLQNGDALRKGEEMKTSILSEKKVTKFISWVRKKERTTEEFIEKFGLTSLKEILEEANKTLSGGKIVHFGYYKYQIMDKRDFEDHKYGNFYKLKYVSKESSFENVIRLSKEIKHIKNVRKDNFEDIIKLAKEVIGERKRTKRIVQIEGRSHRHGQKIKIVTTHTLKNYQKTGADFLIRNKKRLIADPVGVGKTQQQKGKQE